MSVNPISGVNPLPFGSTGVSPVQSGPTGGTPVLPSPAGADRQSGKVDFASALRQYVGEVDRQQQQAGLALQDLIAGRTQDILPAVSAMAKADMSFRLLLGVRNKVIEAYKQTLNMQI